VDHTVPVRTPQLDQSAPAPLDILVNGVRQIFQIALAIHVKTVALARSNPETHTAVVVTLFTLEQTAKTMWISVITYKSSMELMGKL